MKFCKINNSNKHWINLVKGSSVQRPLLHYNAYWYGQSLIIDDIECFLIKKDDNYIGFIVFGSYYIDEYLQNKEESISEIIHLIIDEKFQRKGFGKQIVYECIQRLKENNYDKVYVAIGSENNNAKLFWSKMNFEPTRLKNFDTDNIYQLNL